MRTHPSKSKYKANENTSKHNPKKKQKPTINKKSGKDHCGSKLA
jgi:hypothetical protein